MIPVKILTKKQAIKLGLTDNKSQTPSGSGFCGGGGVIKVNSSGEKTVMESYTDKDGKMELTFMHKERKKYLKGKGNLKDYTKQFSKIPKDVENELLN